MSRYRVVGIEGECEPGSEGLVLANKLGITDSAEMDELELQQLQKLYDHLLDPEHFPSQQLSVQDIQYWHKAWLGNIYPWAGQLRSVNMQKGDFPFAVATQLPRLLDEFEQHCLEPNTPCTGKDKVRLSTSIAEVHAEFILIHPFRDGNGRIARFLADIMAIQCGYQPLNYAVWDENKAYYFKSIQQGLDRNYRALADLVTAAL